MNLLAAERFVDGLVKRSKKPQQVRGLNRNYDHGLKNLFKSTATNAVDQSSSPRPFDVGAANSIGFLAGILMKARA